MNLVDVTAVLTTAVVTTDFIVEILMKWFWICEVLRILDTDKRKKN